MACDPNTLLASAACIECLTPGQMMAIKINLLAQIAGVSNDPNTLLNNARCIECLTPGQMKAIEVYLLCLIAGV